MRDWARPGLVIACLLALPAPARAGFFSLKIEANGLRGPILALLDASGVSTHEFEVVDLVALSKVHAEAAVTVVVATQGTTSATGSSRSAARS